MRTPGPPPSKLRCTLRRLLPFLLVSSAMPGLAARGQDSAPAPGSHAHYAVLTATPHAAPPFTAVDVYYGPRETSSGVPCLWWQLEAREADDDRAAPLFQLRALTREDPLRRTQEALHFERYILRLPATGEALEYVDRHTSKALLPGWKDFSRHFVPHRAASSARTRGVPDTCTYLGHVLTLRWRGDGVPWKSWEDDGRGPRRLLLDPELLVGTGRNFKDAEGHRLPQEPRKQNYTYVPFEAADYRVMIDAGINLYTVKPDQAPFVRSEPVFYLRAAGGEPPLSYPADLYRSNYLGPVMFMDEPTIIMVGDKLIHDTLKYFSDAAALIGARVRARYNSSGSYGAYRLEKSLRDRGVNFGAMRLMQHDYPSWETIFETAHYQMAAGLAGIVHEGRYQLESFDEAVARFSEQPRKHSARELLRYHFAFLRGGTRPFGKYWGTSIYGQCDPEIAPQAVTLAYDMGARYVWFWTSDHGHHLPWPEQLELARTLKEHARAHPRRSIREPAPILDTAIVVPDGYFLSLRNLWWVRVLDPAGENEASRQYRRLMERAMEAFHGALERGEDFDFVVDQGQEIDGYRRVLRLQDS